MNNFKVDFKNNLILLNPGKKLKQFIFINLAIM